MSAIVRTCSKVEPKGRAGGLCALCARCVISYEQYIATPDRTYHSPIQDGVQEWKSRISIRSRDGSQREPSPTSATLTPRLCYGCHTTLTSRSSRPAPSLGLPSSDRSTVPLPLWVGSGVPRSRLSEQQMKDAVSEFLLEGDTS